MITVGAFEAKTHFSALLDKIEAGEEIAVTRHGKRIARIVPDSGDIKSDHREVVRNIKRVAAKSTLGNIDWKELRDFGRK